MVNKVDNQDLNPVYDILKEEELDILGSIPLDEKMAFLRLLNDDFLQSQLTEEYYAANSKDRLKRKE